MKQEQDILEELLVLSEKVFPEQHGKIAEQARRLRTQYCNKEEGKPKEITMHTVEKILPCIAFYKVVTDCTGQPDEAYAIIERYFTKSSEETAKKLQKLCRIPQIYRLVPRVMARIIHKAFGVKSGFEMIDREITGATCHIDMIKCPYFSACTKYECPELTTVFCNSDDISYGNMHSRLSWERTKTLGRGQECCDFILKIRKKKR